MMDKPIKDDCEQVETQSAFSKAINSIRTRFSFASTALLLGALMLFYMGGRIVLVHLIRDAESQVKDGVEVSVGKEKPQNVSVAIEPVEGKAGDRGLDFSLQPMIDEAMSYYTGGFWELGRRPPNERVSITNLVGSANNPQEIAVTFRSPFTGIAQSAMLRLVFFIAVLGIVLVLLFFWMQCRVILNPLTKMTRLVAELGKHNADIDCPRLEWTGRDEFAMLALSVNRMLETISRRSLAVANAEKMHHALIDALPDALAIFDPSGRLVAINKEAEGVEKLPGLKPGEKPSETVFGKLPVEDFLHAVDSVFRNGGVGKTRLKVMQDEGPRGAIKPRHFELRITRMDEYFALAIIRDVSEEVAEHHLRIAAETRALDIKKRESLTLLAAGIAHDMNNVLTVILSAAESANAEEGVHEQVKSQIASIRESVRRGSAMMRELMTFAGENKIALVRVDPNMIVDDVKLLTSGVVGRNIIVNYDKPKSLPAIDADPNQLWKVIFNIVKNAGEAIGTRPGRINISTSQLTMTEELASKYVSAKPLTPGEGMLFTIEDDGPGIKSDLLPKLFDPYVSSKAVGRGLGLATVRTIVEAHGGGISVQSAIDRGTTFRIYLPASRLKEPPAPKVEKKFFEPVNDTRKGVLVVDDEESILKTTSILLRTLGMKAYVAKDNQEAMAIMRRSAAELKVIILDADLGGVDTVRLLNALRSSAPDVPVVVSSGSAEEHIAKLFADAPYDSFLAKPYTLIELKSKVQGAKRVI